MKSFSLYIHIPFCYHKCPYCDFNTYAVATAPERNYLSALLAELDYRATLPEWRGRTVQTIYFGGGTPSIFAPATIRKMISAISERFPVANDAEISLEANPGPLAWDSLEGFREAGINRLSLGAQSFNPETLKVLGRPHAPNHIESAVLSAQNIGFKNINIDLMYGVPGQTLDDVHEDLERACELGPQHISPYGLTIEKGTPFYAGYKRGVLKLPREGVVVKMMREVQRVLSRHGFTRYEISNFSVEGYEARHNMAYWGGSDYLGLGAGAHSYFAAPEEAKADGNFGSRWCNFALPDRYAEATISSGKADSWSEALSFRDAVFEFFFLGLRRIRGVDGVEFEQRFGVSADEVYPTALKSLTERKLLRRRGTRLALSTRGLMLADSVIEAFATPERTAAPAPVPDQAANG